MRQLIASEKLVFGSIVLLGQWAFANIMLISSASHRRTLRDIEAAYLQIQQLDHLEEVKDQFITNVNHELRNPTMALQGYIELLRLRHEVVSPERRIQLIERAARASDDLVALLTSVLETQRFDVGAQQFTPEAVNVRATMEDAARLIDPREGNMVERNLRVQIPEKLAVWGDQVRLRQIFTNLLSNAIKYSASGSTMEVSASLLQAPPQGGGILQRPAHVQAQPMVEIYVRDYGLGIPPDQKPLLFKRFVRLPRDLASSVLGNGLGLYLCRILAEAMGGTISVESTGREGEGSTFIMRLPAPPSGSALRQLSTANGGSGKPRSNAPLAAGEPMAHTTLVTPAPTTSGADLGSSDPSQQPARSAGYLDSGVVTCQTRLTT